jgi:hypothetical protein
MPFSSPVVCLQNFALTLAGRIWCCCHGVSARTFDGRVHHRHGRHHHDHCDAVVVLGAIFYARAVPKIEEYVNAKLDPLRPKKPPSPAQPGEKEAVLSLPR